MGLAAVVTNAAVSGSSVRAAITGLKQDPPLARLAVVRVGRMKCRTLNKLSFAVVVHVAQDLRRKVSLEFRGIPRPADTVSHSVTVGSKVALHMATPVRQQVIPDIPPLACVPIL
jgi:hypothetical protein